MIQLSRKPALSWPAMPRENRQAGRDVKEAPAAAAAAAAASAFERMLWAPPATRRWRSTHEKRALEREARGEAACLDRLHDIFALIRAGGTRMKGERCPERSQRRAGSRRHRRH